MNSTELKVEMLRNNINQTQLAEALDITKGALSKKINGITEFSRKDIAVIKKVLGLSDKRIGEIFLSQKFTSFQLQYSHNQIKNTKKLEGIKGSDFISKAVKTTVTCEERRKAKEKIIETIKAQFDIPVTNVFIKSLLIDIIHDLEYQKHDS